MSLVRIENLDHACCAIVLDRADKLNALSGALLDDLIRTLAEVHTKALDHFVRSVVLKSSTEKAFCVGADLSERIKMNAEQVSATLLKQRQLMDAIAALPVPTFAFLRGAAFGGGLEMALACDFRFCTPDASMGLTETKLGIIPGAGGTQRLSRLLGEEKAKELIFTARRLNGSEAAAYGLVTDCRADAENTIKEWAKAIEASAPMAVISAKRAIEGGRHMSLGAALDFERACYEIVLHTEDRIEGLKAFSEKRAPKYTGK